MIKIFQVNDINPDLLETQLASFKKYMQEDFEFVVFNSERLSHDLGKAQGVTKACQSLGITVVEVLRDPAIENVWLRGEGAVSQRPLFSEEGRYTKGLGGDMFNYSLQWAWEKVITKEQGPICFCHSDIFLMEPINLSNYLLDKPLCFLPLSELSYIWEAMLLADIPKLPLPETMLWFPGVVEGKWHDTGGPTYHWLQAHPEVPYTYIGEVHVPDDPNVDFHPSRYTFFEMPDGKKVFHYQSGSRWFTDMPTYKNFSAEKSDDYHAKKLAFARRVIGL